MLEGVSGWLAMLEVATSTLGRGMFSRVRHSPPSNRAERLIFAAFFAALPPLAPDRWRSGAGYLALGFFLLDPGFRYRVVDFTPSTSADGSNTQMKPLLASSVGGSWSTFLKPCDQRHYMAFANQAHGKLTPFIERLCLMLFCQPFELFLALSVFFSNHR